MSHSVSEKLVMMANQIAKAFEPQGEARALPQIREHIHLFWDPRMRRGMDEIISAGGQGLHPFAYAALKEDVKHPHREADQAGTKFPMDASSVDGGTD
ncbi:formate dehydrogenase subunit delta [Methylobrevis pamukkalensis]|uniref:NADH-dependent formate dehydrogenase delta subunit FdsD n=1 Tax=Methylobrevis pamukkalensis TaxID=1439726 RepID=A0A1E3H6Z0_9HYPH|nr:formate dehydrogenase subunit delta [Methylobrevis pamukkalensis]ODN71546.1 NADH-dependent formate dehydrogenase delta subunit FdsD [Methylobrevis pamukkalensis]